MSEKTIESLTLAETLEQIQAGAVWTSLENHGHLMASDRDRLDLLHRLSTNNMTKLQEGHFMPSVLTNSVARIIDLIMVFNRGEQALIVTGEGRASVVENWLRRNIFFNDKFKLENVSDTLSQIGIFGAGTQACLEAHWPELRALGESQFTTLNGILVAKINEIGGAGYWLIGENEALQTIVTALDIPQINHDTYEILRMMAGVPSAQSEANGDFIPLEIGLWNAVSFNKGCYTGQEIIARMESRGKLAKMMVRVQAEALIPNHTDLHDIEGKSVGLLTSVAEKSMNDGTLVGLAVVKPAYIEANTQLQATAKDGTLVNITVLGLAGHYETNYS